MQTNLCYKKLFYHKKSNTQSTLLQINDIVKVKGKNYSLLFMDDTNMIGIDMYGNQIEFTINEIEKIVFQDSKQLKMDITPTEQKITQLEKTLNNLNQKLKIPNNTLSQIQCLKILAKSVREEIKSLKPKVIYKQLSLC